MTTKTDMNQNLAINYIPDADGVIYIKGQEVLAHTFNIKNEILKSAQTEVNTLKEQVRVLAAAAAKTAGAGAKRVLLLGLRGTAVSVGVTDAEKAGNRNQITKDKMDELIRLGGLATLGLGPEQLFEADGALPPRFLLTGAWYDWFDKNVLAKGLVPEQYVGVGKGVEMLPAESGKTKISALGIKALRDVLASGSEAAKTVAGFLLEVGVKAFSVTPDFGDK